MDDKCADTQAEGIVNKLESLKKRLTRLEVKDKKYSDCTVAVPLPDGIDINKLADGGVFMTDTCNTAQKLRRTLVDMVNEWYDLDCMNHLRNVWFGKWRNH